jgi:hypothetical protein
MMAEMVEQLAARGLRLARLLGAEHRDELLQAGDERRIGEGFCIWGQGSMAACPG